MNRHSLRLLALVLMAAVSDAMAQEAPQLAQPVKEHQWLEQFVGEWSTQSKAEMGPGQPPLECSGSLSSRMIGGFWVLNETKGDFLGTPVVGIQTVGYDAEKKKYIGTWVDSMANHLWRYEGSVDDSGKILTLEAEGPNLMAGGKVGRFQDVYEFKSADELAISSKMLGDDGQWITFMTGTAKRIK